MAAVDHNGGEAAVNAALAELKCIAVVKMYADGEIGFDDCSFDELHKIGMVCILPCACADLQDKGSVLFLGSFGDALDDLHVVDVESADGITALVSFPEHFGTGNKWHNKILLDGVLISAFKPNNLFLLYTPFRDNSTEI